MPRDLPLPRELPAPAAGHAGRELEWQLLAEDLDAVRSWLNGHPKVTGCTVAPLPPQRLRDTYLDTADWRLFRSGFALRLRERDTALEATLKGLRSERKDLADRVELTETLHEGPATLARAPGPVGVRIREITAAAPVRALFRVQTRRQRYGVRRDGQLRDIGEIALDETSLLRASGGGFLERLRRVEVEASDPESLQPLASLVEALRAACRLRPATENKFAAGLRAAGLLPPGT